MMNNGELVGKVCSSMYRQCRERGYATPVDVLMEIGVLPKKKYEGWRFGRIPYLESVCTVNLHKLSFVMHQMRVICPKERLKALVLLLSAAGCQKRKTGRVVLP